MTMARKATAALAAAAAILCASGLARAAEPDIYMYTGADRAQKVLEGAKKEGALTLYSSLTVDGPLRGLAESFQKAHPDIKLDYWRGDNREIFQKISAEARANKRIADVIESASISGAMKKANLSRPFISPAAATFAPQHVDPDHLFVATRLNYFGLAYNTKNVPESLLPKTYQDLADPKYKGKLVWRAQSESGANLFMTMILKTMGDKAGGDWLKKLSENKVINSLSSARNIVDRVGQGEYDMAINMFAHHPLISKAKGAPLDVLMLDPIPAVFGAILAVREAPHPYASMLLIDHILGTDGQKVLQAADYLSPRPDLPPDEKMLKILPRVNKLKELAIDTDDILEYQSKVDPIYEEYFK
jgi:ABC-type Fe3+ transport system substrate-binding protein